MEWKNQTEVRTQQQPKTGVAFSSQHNSLQHGCKQHNSTSKKEPRHVSPGMGALQACRLAQPLTLHGCAGALNLSAGRKHPQQMQLYGARLKPQSQCRMPRASARGAPRPGRPRALCASLCQEITALYYSQYISVRSIAKMYNLSHSTVWRTVNSAPAQALHD